MIKKPSWLSNITSSEKRTISYAFLQANTVIVQAECHHKISISIDGVIRQHFDRKNEAFCVFRISKVRQNILCYKSD